MLDHPTAARERMSSESNLARGSEEANAERAVPLGCGSHKRGFRVVGFRGDRLHNLFGKPSRIQHNRKLIPGVGAFGEDVDYVEGAGHRLRARPTHFLKAMTAPFIKTSSTASAATRANAAT